MQSSDNDPSTPINTVFSWQNLAFHVDHLCRFPRCFICSLFERCGDSNI